MSSDSSDDQASHAAILSDTLRQLELNQETTGVLSSLNGDDENNQHFTSGSHTQEGHGSRPGTAGLSTPLSRLAAADREQSSPLPPNEYGLGWPGKNLEHFSMVSKVSPNN